MTVMIASEWINGGAAWYRINYLVPSKTIARVNIRPEIMNDIRLLKYIYVIYVDRDMIHGPIAEGFAFSINDAKSIVDDVLVNRFGCKFTDDPKIAILL